MSIDLQGNSLRMTMTFWNGRSCGELMTEFYLGQLIQQARDRIELRDGVKVTQWDLAFAIGKDQAYVSKILTGQRPATDETLRAWAPILELSFRTLILARSGERVESPWEDVVEGRVNEVDVRYVGIVPADALRWTAIQEGNEKMRVWDELLDAHAPDTCFVARVSGDCLAARHIVDGDYVLLCEWKPGDELHDGEIVMARIGDEYSLKIWSTQNGQMLLSDGNGQVVYRGRLEDEAITVLGRFVAQWNISSRRGMR